MDTLRVRIVAAFAAIYLIWGATYYFIAVAVESIPPYLMAGLRFLPAGLFMVVWAVRRGAPWPDLHAMGGAWVVGTLMLTGGNGAVSFVETRMPTGMAALMIATVPMWVVVFEAVRTRCMPRPMVIAGLAAGVLGVALLSGADAGWVGGRADPRYVALVLAGAAAWALGSLRSRGSPITSLEMRSGMQMLGGSLSFATVALLRGEQVVWAEVPVSAWASIAVLTVFGSIIAFTAYGWLLRTVPAASAATYAFVNPVVAIVLGIVLRGEPMTVRTALAAAFIVLAVVVINRASAHAARAAAAPKEPVIETDAASL